MSVSTYSSKVLELVAKEVGEYFTGNEIVKILMEFGMAREVIQYPNTKWWTINEAFKYIKKNEKKPDDLISKLIATFLHPLNHNLDWGKTEKLRKQIKEYLLYDNFYIESDSKEYFIFSEEEMKEMHSSSPEGEQVAKYEDEEKLKKNNDNLKKLSDTHQSYMDIVDIFCQNTKKPTEELNDAYLFLFKKMQEYLKKLDLRYHKIHLYKPFEDLYSAEIQWNGNGGFDDFRMGPKLSWDAVRPNLYKVHSEIKKLYNLALENTQMTDDEKKLEDIVGMISEKRAPKIVAEKEKVNKLEILHKYEKDNKDPLYITKKEDDFNYKGRYINLSKKTDYFKVFYALYAKLPEGGEISYKDLGKEIVGRLPKTKEYTDTEMQKFIQRNLTDKSNGFMRYADIPETEDNGKPLIKVIRDFGVCFNNKAG